MQVNTTGDEDSPTTSTAYTPKKVTILYLGGALHRLWAVAYLAKKFPDAQIIIGSEAFPREVVEFLAKHNIDLKRVVFNYDAWDTVTTFVVTYDIIRKNKTDILYVVTDLFHIRRSMSIANVVYAFTGIEVLDYASYLGDLSKVESNRLVYWDTIRATLWKIFRVYPKEINGRMERILEYKRQAKELGVL